MKKTLVGWVARNKKLRFSRTPYVISGDECKLKIYRGNPNPTNYTETNHWEKAKITIEEIPPQTKAEVGGVGEGTMLDWFATAIMAEYDKTKGR